MKFCFIIPIHIKHYNYIYNLLNLIDANKIEVDIYLVFSNESDYNIFNKKDKTKNIVMPNINTPTPSIVTYKKFYALNQLKDNPNYDYFIVCDAEISIIPENFNEENILNKINKIYENKTIYGGEVDINCIKNITQSSTYSIFGGDKLKETTHNYNLYIWWSDLPVYKREYLSHFLSLIDYNKITQFDHIIYLYYLILHHDFNILNITPLVNHTWSLESYNTRNVIHLNILKNHNYGFSFITPQLYNNNEEFLKKEGSFLLYHLDR